MRNDQLEKEFINIIENEILWTKNLPLNVFSRKWPLFFFYASSLITESEFMEDLLRWNEECFSSNVVIGIRRKDGIQSSFPIFHDVNGSGIDGSAKLVRDYFMLHLTELDDSACVAVNRNLDWIIYEDISEDFGVLACKENYGWHGASWTSLSRHVFTENDVRVALYAESDNGLQNTVAKSFLEIISLNYLRNGRTSQ